MSETRGRSSWRVWISGERPGAGCCAPYLRVPNSRSTIHVGAAAGEPDAELQTPERPIRVSRLKRAGRGDHATRSAGAQLLSAPCLCKWTPREPRMPKQAGSTVTDEVRGNTTPRASQGWGHTPSPVPANAAKTRRAPRQSFHSTPSFADMSRSGLRKPGKPKSPGFESVLYSSRS